LPWLENYQPPDDEEEDINDIDDDDEEEEQEEQEEQKREGENEEKRRKIEKETNDQTRVEDDDKWLFSSKDHNFIGRSVRLSMALNGNLDVTEATEAFWVDGKVVSYLPPNDLEPLALWKVLAPLDKKADAISMKSWRKEEKETAVVFANNRLWSVLCEDHETDRQEEENNVLEEAMAFGDWEVRDLEEHEVQMAMTKYPQ